MSSAAAAVSTFVERLRGEPGGASRRMRERMLALVLVFLTGYLALGITDQYPTVFIAVVAVGVLIFMIENQEKTLYLLLWFSTIYALLKATVLGWSALAFLFKEGFLVLLIAFWLFHFALRQERFPETSLNRPIAVLVGWILLECFNPNNFGLLAVADDLRHWLGGIVIFFLTVSLVDDEIKVERGLRVVFGYATLAMVYGLSQQFMPRDLLVKLGADPNSYFYFWEDTTRSFSTMGTAPFAIFSSMFPCIAFFYASQQDNPLRRFVLNSIGLGFLAAVLLTLVRTSWVSTTLSVLIYTVLAKRWKLLVLLLVLALLVGTLSSGYMRTKVEGLLNPATDQSIRTRILIAQLVSDAVVFRVFGYGIGTFSHSKWGVEEAGKVGYGTQTENWYLTVALELGWVGIGLIFWIWYKIYRMAWRGYRGDLKTRRYQEMSLALAGGMLAIEIARVGGPAGYFPPDSWHYWFFAALIVTLPKIDAARSAREAERVRPATAAALALDARLRVPRPV